MKCRNCGFEFDDGSICPTCGTENADGQLPFFGSTYEASDEKYTFEPFSEQKSRGSEEPPAKQGSASPADSALPESGGDSAKGKTKRGKKRRKTKLPTKRFIVAVISVLCAVIIACTGLIWYFLRQFGLNIREGVYQAILQSYKNGYDNGMSDNGLSVYNLNTDFFNSDFLKTGQSFAYELGTVTLVDVTTKDPDESTYFYEVAFRFEIANQSDSEQYFGTVLSRADDETSLSSSTAIRPSESEFQIVEEGWLCSEIPFSAGSSNAQIYLEPAAKGEYTVTYSVPRERQIDFITLTLMNKADNYTVNVYYSL